MLKKFCIPNIDKMPASFDRDYYDNLIGEFGLDDVQEFIQDVVEARPAFVLVFVSGILVTICYAALIYYLTGILVWLSIIVAGIAILALSIMVRNYHN